MDHGVGSLLICEEKMFRKIKEYYLNDFFFKLFVRIKIVLKRYGFKTFFTTAGSWLDIQGCRNTGRGAGGYAFSVKIGFEMV